MPAPPRVSVMIPTYNYAHYLDDAIQSVLNQTYNDYELIIVDNASTDNTDAIVAKYLYDPRIRYYKNEQNLGLVGNWNKCLEYARGEFLKMLCADDKFRPELLSKYVHVMDLYPQLSMVACNKQVFGDKHNYEVVITRTHLQKGKDMNFHMLYGHQGVGEPSSVMFRRREFNKIGYFTNEYKQFIDFDYWLKLLNNGDCYIIPEILVDVRFHSTTNTHQLKTANRYLKSFELYQISKNVQQHVYNIDTTDTQIDQVVHGYAMECVKNAMLKTATSLHKKQSRIAFTKAFRIAWKEKLFKSTLKELTAGIGRQISRKIK
jgi:GT2 family glycosyltransferase